MLFFCQEPQPMVSVKPRPELKPPPLPKVWAKFDEHPHDVEILGEFAGPAHVGGVDAAGMALALVLQDRRAPLPWRPRSRGRGRP